MSIHWQKESYTDREDVKVDFSGELFAPPNSVMYSIFPWPSGDLDLDDEVERERFRLPGGLGMKSKIHKQMQILGMSMCLRDKDRWIELHIKSNAFPNLFHC